MMVQIAGVFAFLSADILFKAVESIDVQYCWHKNLVLQCGYNSDVAVRSVTWSANKNEVSSYTVSTNVTTNINADKYIISGTDYSLKIFNVTAPEDFECFVNNYFNHEFIYSWTTKQYKNPNLTADGCRGDVCRIPIDVMSLSCTAITDQEEDVKIVWTSTNDQLKFKVDTTYYAGRLVSTITYAAEEINMEDNITCTLYSPSTCGQKTFIVFEVIVPSTDLPNSGRSMHYDTKTAFVVFGAICMILRCLK